VLPKAMAYATVAGLPVAVGLYTALIPMAIYALFGSSRVLSVSSTTTLAILAGTQLGLAVPDGDPARLLTATATLSALVPEFTRPTYSSIAFGLFPAATMRVGASMSCGMATDGDP
jgi:MFS superfamily sulfate permease-like transporter